MKIRQQLQCELARREFWEYCKLMASDFYKEDRGYLYNMATTLQDFIYSDNQVLCINLPPRHGKSRTATLFIEWLLGRDKHLKIMTGSYNETLSTTFSKQVRGTIQELKADEDKIVYSDIFDSKIKYGDGAANLWSLEGNNNANYLATSPTGTATGFGADILLIDDIIKNAEEANNATVLDKHWEWFTNTMLSRLQGMRKVILIMTRWATKDLCGRAINHFREIGINPVILTMKALEDNNMLCEEVLNRQQYNILEGTLGQDILSANYNQIPIDLKGVLYTYFMEYEELPTTIKAVENYTDTADTGSDYLCSINYAVGIDNKAYILDILFTKKPMEITEEETAKMLTKDNVNYARVESNNGGRGFSRNVERICKKELGNRHTMFKPFTQKNNKISRILTGATGVMQNIYFPKGWQYKYKEFYNSISVYQREGKNKHDDDADTLTGVYEMLFKNYIKKCNFSKMRL